MARSSSRASVVQGSFVRPLTRAPDRTGSIQARGLRGTGLASHALLSGGATATPRVNTVQRTAQGAAFQLAAGSGRFGRGMGRRMPTAVQRKMEAFFGSSFGDVRVHVGPEAASIGALAFTHGSNIYFAPGQYNPTSHQGQRLLGHELTHVVQQRAGRVRNPFGSGVAVVQDVSLEAEAERMGARVATLPPTVQTKPANGLPTKAVLPGHNAERPATHPSYPPRRTATTGGTLQRMRLVNLRPTWTETASYVKDHPTSFAATAYHDFGAGRERSFQCSGCHRWLPVSRATVDHIVPKSYLKSMIDKGGLKGGQGLVNMNRARYGLNQDLDWFNVKYRVNKGGMKGWKWSGKKKLRDHNHADEVYLEAHALNDLDNLQLMCHSCNSSKRNSNNPNGAGAPPANVGVKTTTNITIDSLPHRPVVAIDLSPGVSGADSHPSARFSTAWGKTRRFFLAEKYHAVGIATADFGPGAEPVYTCGGCSRRLPIAIATVDHVQPKEGYWWRSLDLTNLALMCNICNSSKNNT